MNLSCLPVSWFPQIIEGTKSVEEWLRFAGEAGLDGADLSVALLPDQRAETLRQLRRTAEDTGIKIVMLCTYSDFTSPEAEERSRQIEQLRAHIVVARELGATLIRVTAGQAHPGVSLDDGLTWAVEGLTTCLDEARKNGVRLVYENHTKGYPWTYSDFSQPKEVFLEIVRRTEGTSLGVNYDTANPLLEREDPLALMEQVVERIVSLHVNDIQRAGHFEPVLIGDGVSPIEEIFARAKKRGFTGWVCIEEASRRDEDGFRRAIAFARQAWASA